MAMSATLDRIDQDLDSFWDASLFTAPQTGSIEFGGDFPTVPIDPGFSFNDSAINTPRSSSLEWPGSHSEWRSTESTPPALAPKRSGKIMIEPRPQAQRRRRKQPSGEALERRRQQNRAAQLAFRERSKRQVEEMRQELLQCTEFNQRLYSSVRELMERTDSLKKDMEAILSMEPPVTSCDTEWTSRTNSMDIHTSPTSPESPSDYHNLDEEGSSTGAS